MTINEWIIIVAIILGPILAIQLQEFLSGRKEKRTRKMQIFRALMITRDVPISLLHVESLNGIDVEFYKDKDVVNAWRLLQDNFAHYPKDYKASNYQTLLDACGEKSKELLSDLLYKMAKSLKYDFDKIHLKRGGYIPQGYLDTDLEERIIRRGVAEIIVGRKSIPVNIVDIPKTKENKPLLT